MTRGFQIRRPFSVVDNFCGDRLKIDSPEVNHAQTFFTLQPTITSIYATTAKFWVLMSSTVYCVQSIDRPQLALTGPPSIVVQMEGGS